jgi:hypothetical protein
MQKGEAYLKHINTPKSITLKKWSELPTDQKMEFSEELHFPNIPGDIKVDVFGEELKKGAPVYAFKIKGIRAYCIVGNYNKLTNGQKEQFEKNLIQFPGI